MSHISTPRDIDQAETEAQPTLQWITPEVTKLDLETAQQTAIPS